MKKYIPFVVIGSNPDGKANKGFFAYSRKELRGKAVSVCEVNPVAEVGEEISTSEITGEYFTMYFTSPKALKGVICFLQKLYDKWTDEQKGMK